MDQVEQVKNKLDIVEVVRDYVTLKKAGRNFKGLCPFHNEKTPSFMVNPELQIYKCFGCGAGGDLYSFIEKMEGVDFREALEMLAERAGIELEAYSDGEGRSEQKRMIEAHQLASEYYNYLLVKHKTGRKALDYLEERGVGKKLIEEFKLGYALKSWEGLYKYLVKKKGLKADLLVRAGLLIKSKKGGGYYDRFRGRVMFPLIDHRGRVLGFGGRVMPGMGDEKTPKYINSPESEIYHKSEMLYGYYQAKGAIREKDRVVVVEGELDMISSFKAGVTETVAIKGTALTEQQVKLVNRLTDRVILALDSDKAGQKATKRSIKMAESENMKVRVVEVKGGKDPDDVVRESVSKWVKMVEGAEEIYDYLIERGESDFDLGTGEGKSRFTDQVLPVLFEIQNQVVKAYYLKKVAKILQVSEEWVAKEMERKRRRGRVKSRDEGKREKKKKKEESRKDQLLEEIWAYLLRADKEEVEKGIKRLKRIGDEMRLSKLLDNWEEYFEGKNKRKVVDWIKQLPSELKALPEAAYIREIEEKRVNWNLQVAIDEYKELRLREMLNRVSKEIERLEEGGDEEKLREAQEKFVRLSKELS